ncbi:MAG: hypothetical protein AB7W37_06340 [Syntrophobacteraceae bacterium]
MLDYQEHGLDLGPMGIDHDDPDGIELEDVTVLAPDDQNEEHQRLDGLPEQIRTTVVDGALYSASGDRSPHKGVGAIEEIDQRMFVFFPEPVG